jgi:ABC-type dipeptide/oligopeptide/nickel transport system permease component
MRNYVIRRLLLAIPTIFGVATLVFLTLQLAPGDPVDLFVPPDTSGEVKAEAVEAIRKMYGFDKPLHEQYLVFITKMARLDFGRSIRQKTLVSEDLSRRIPNTLQLGLTSLAVSATVGISFGIISAVRRGSLLDNTVMFGALFGVSMPSFWIGLMLMLVFGLTLRVLPPSGFGGPAYTWQGLRYMVLPVVTLGLGGAGGLARYTRSSMLDVINQDYIRTARAKGLSERVTIYKHALRNALIPVVTVLGLSFGFIFGGTVITETVFAWPGVGRYLISGINGRDFPVVQATVFIMAMGFVVANLTTDLMYAFINPRIRYE